MWCRGCEQVSDVLFEGIDILPAGVFCHETVVIYCIDVLVALCYLHSKTNIILQALDSSDNSSETHGNWRESIITRSHGHRFYLIQQSPQMQSPLAQALPALNKNGGWHCFLDPKVGMLKGQCEVLRSKALPCSQSIGMQSP